MLLLMVLNEHLSSFCKKKKKVTLILFLNLKHNAEAACLTDICGYIEESWLNIPSQCLP